MVGYLSRCNDRQRLLSLHYLYMNEGGNERGTVKRKQARLMALVINLSPISVAERRYFDQRCLPAFIIPAIWTARRVLRHSHFRDVKKHFSGVACSLFACIYNINNKHYTSTFSFGRKIRAICNHQCLLYFQSNFDDRIRDDWW